MDDRAYGDSPVGAIIDSGFGWGAMVALIVAAVIGGAMLGGLALRLSGYWPPSRPGIGGTPTPSLDSVVALSPPAGQPGTTFEVSGAGWVAGETITITLYAPTGASIPSVDVLTTRVGADGTFRVPLTAPVIRPWSTLDAFVVAGRSSGATATATFSLVPPAVTVTPTAISTPTPTQTPLPPTPTSTPEPLTPTPEAPSWRGEYYNNLRLAGQPALVRDDPAINFDWENGPPAPGMLSDGFSVRWSRTQDFEAGTYRFYAIADDGVRVWLDNQLLIGEWHDAQLMTYTEARTLGRGEHTLTVEYYEAQGDARIQVWWERIGAFSEWRGAYFDNPSLTGKPVFVRNDERVNFAWGEGAPDRALPTDGFSVRWTRTMRFESDTYRFRVLVDDGARLYVDGRRVIDAWTTGSQREVSVELPLATGYHTLELEYFESAGLAEVQMVWEALADYPDWRGEYWANVSLSGLPILIRNDEEIAFNWGRDAPAPGLPDDGFSVRWTDVRQFSVGTYRFSVIVDDGARLWVDDRLVIDEWQNGAAREVTGEVTLPAGEHTVLLAYYERAGQASIRLSWEEVSPTDTPTPTSTSTPTLTPSSTSMPTASPTSTSTLTPTPTGSPTPTATPTGSPTPTSTPTSTLTPTPTPTESPAQPKPMM